ncbi:MAG: hypothetical protein ACLQVJ_01025 [Syntrophobacteraceae bacterium]
MDYKKRLSDEFKSADTFAQVLLNKVPPEYANMSDENLKAWAAQYETDLEHAQTTKEEAALIGALLGLQSMLAAREMSSILGRIEKSIKDRWTFAYANYRLGYLKGLIEGRTLTQHPDFERIFQSLSGSKNVGKRWEEDREDYELAQAEAAAYYEGGGEDTHDKVAKRLAKKYKVSPNTLRNNIKPLARRYGKVKGDKKYR